MSYPSVAAGVVDKNGGLRIVVTQPWLVRNHLFEGERSFVVPKLRVREPLTISQAAPIIETVKKHVATELK